MADWADYGREDGHADALAGIAPQIDRLNPATDYGQAYLEAYDATLAELAPDYIRPVRV